MTLKTLQEARANKERNIEKLQTKLQGEQQQIIEKKVRSEVARHIRHFNVSHDATTTKLQTRLKEEQRKLHQLKQKMS